MSECDDAFLDAIKAILDDAWGTKHPVPTAAEREMAATFFLGPSQAEGMSIGSTARWTEELAKLLARHRDSVETASMCPGPHG